MKVLKANQIQYDSLNGYVSTSGTDRFEFIKDANNNWVCGLANLTNPAFTDIHDQLSELQQIDWVSPIPEGE